MIGLIVLYTYKGQVSRMAKWSVTNEQIAKKLEEFGLPVEYGNVSEEVLETYNFFYYREEEMRPEGKIFTQTLNIYYVSFNQEDLREAEIIKALRSIKLQLSRITYDRLQIENTNNFVDVVTFVVTRKLKVDC